MTMKAIFQKDTVIAATDVQGWGVEVIIEGERRALKASVGKDPWWEKSGELCHHAGNGAEQIQTPFAILWGDYDVQVQPK
jgi:hypothetical protein